MASYRPKIDMQRVRSGSDMSWMDAYTRLITSPAARRAAAQLSKDRDALVLASPSQRMCQLVREMAELGLDVFQQGPMQASIRRVDDLTTYSFRAAVMRLHNLDSETVIQTPRPVSRAYEPEDPRPVYRIRGTGRISHFGQEAQNASV